MVPVRIRHSSHHFATQSSHSVDLAGWQAKIASIESWIPWRNAHKSWFSLFNHWCRLTTLKLDSWYFIHSGFKILAKKFGPLSFSIYFYFFSPWSGLVSSLFSPSLFFPSLLASLLPLSQFLYDRYSFCWSRMTSHRRICIFSQSQ